MRTDDKVAQAEVHTLQLKFEARTKIHEESAKAVHAQLAGVRREREQYKEQVLQVERRMVDMKQRHMDAEREWLGRVETVGRVEEECDALKVQLDKVQHEHDALATQFDTDRRVWAIERGELCDRLREAVG